VVGIGGENTENGYHFWHVKQQNIIDDNQTLISTLGQAESIDVDVISGESVMDVILSYDKNSQIIRILKSLPVKGLLNNPQYLDQINLRVSPQDCVLVLLSDENEKKILGMLDMENPVVQYASTTDKLTQFQISILVQLIDYENKQKMPVPISGITDPQSCLASIKTKMVFSENTPLSTVNETEFFLVKKHQICLVLIEPLKDVLIAVYEGVQINQQYLIDATVDDVYKQNNNIEQDHYLLCGQDFVPSRETLLRLLVSTAKSSIDFQVIDRKPQANVTVTCVEQETPIQFHCAEVMKADRIREIVCQSWKLNKRFYSLTLTDGAEIEDDYTLNDTGEDINDLRLLLTPTADVKCTISYGDITVTIPTTNETVASEILREALEKLLIPVDDMDKFQLNLLDDPESPSDVDLDTPIDDIRGVLPDGAMIIPFQLRKKQTDN
jgi:hypothetical protein